MLAPLLALLASFTWGSSSYLGGIESRRRSVWHVTALSQIAAALVAVLALVVVRESPPGVWDHVMLVTAGVITAVGLVAFYRALAIGTMSVVAPIMASQVVIPVAAGLLRGERPGLYAYAGMVVTVGGVVLIALARSSRRDHVARRAVWLAILTAACWGFLLMTLGVSGHDNPYWAVFDTRLVSAASLTLWVLATRKGLPLKGQNLPALFAVGGLLAVANILYTVATGVGYLSVVGILGALSPVVVTAYAQILLRERLTPHQWVGFAMVFAGIVLLSL